MTMKRIVTVGSANLAFDSLVEIVIDEEGAEYIALIMEQEFKRSADAGAFAIACEIRKSLSA